MTSEPEVLGPSDELLHRQAHPNRVDLNEPDHVVFLPQPSDNRLLSTRRNTVLSAQEAYEYHLGLGLQSAGTWSMTLEEVASTSPAEGIPAPPALDDATDQSPGHVSIDFSKLPTKADRTAVARALRSFAVARGRTFPL